MTYQTGPMSVPLSVRLFVWCQWFKKPKAPRPLGQGQRNLACVFYGSEDRTSRKQNFEFWHLHCAGLCQTQPSRERYGMVQQSLTSHSTHYRSFRRRFYGSYDPTNSIIALKDKTQSGEMTHPSGVLFVFLFSVYTKETYVVWSPVSQIKTTKIAKIKKVILFWQHVGVKSLFCDILPFYWQDYLQSRLLVFCLLSGPKKSVFLPQRDNTLYL